MHGGKTGDRDRVEEREDIGREPLISEHACKGVPEESDRLRVLYLLPMHPLESFDCGKSTPIDCIDVPDGDWAHYTGDSITKQPNGESTQDHGACLYR
jgi:hypothetical protein